MGFSLIKAVAGLVLIALTARGAEVAGESKDAVERLRQHLALGTDQRPAIGDQVLMGADMLPEQYEKPQGFSLSLQIQSTTQAERIFQLLAEEGTVMMALEKTFWAARFGVLVDRFGIRWQINCEGSDQVVAV